MIKSLDGAVVFGWAVVQTSDILRNQYRGTSTRDQITGEKTRGASRSWEKGNANPAPSSWAALAREQPAGWKLIISYHWASGRFNPMCSAQIQELIPPWSRMELRRGPGSWVCSGAQERRKGDLPQPSAPGQLAREDGAWPFSAVVSKRLKKCS